MSQTLRVAVIDGQPEVARELSRRLSREDLSVRAFPSGRAFLDEVQEEPHHLALCDLRLPDMSAFEVLADLRRRGDESDFVVVSAEGSSSLAVRALKLGASRFLSKPLRSDELLPILQAIRTRLERGGAGLRRRPEPPTGGSESWRALLDRARRAADSPYSILVVGETGAGKDVVARYVHAESPRAIRPFVALNCAALPESLIESELFGHAKGAFSGAAAPRAGLFEAADGGTLFLDEIGSAPLAVQAKLLRVVEERAVRRVGENRAIAVDVRLIAATNVDLPSAVARREFREDLYFRIATVTLVVPPLRDRREDIALLAKRFLADFRRPGEPPRMLSHEALDFLETYPFPGNVRELQHALAEACLFSRSTELGIEDFRSLLARAVFRPAPTARRRTPHELSEEEVRRALEESGGRRIEAAHRLGISRSSFYRLLQRSDGRTSPDG